MARMVIVALAVSTSERQAARPVATTASDSSTFAPLRETQVGDDLGQHLADDVADVAHPVHGRHGVRARVADQALGVEVDDAVADPRGTAPHARSAPTVDGNSPAATIRMSESARSR